MRVLLMLLSSVLLLQFAGCKSFRKTFSRTPDSMRRSPARQAKAPAPAHRANGRTGNDLYDTVFHRGRPDNRPVVSSSELSDSERALVERSFRSSRHQVTDDPEVRRINERNRDSRIRNKDSVFGTRNGSYF